MSTFKELVIAEYPIPLVASLFGTTLPVETRVNIDTIIEAAMRESESYIVLYDSMEATGLATQLPEDTLSVSSVKLSTQFQGNRYVKWTYDYATKVVTLRTYPATIKFKRALLTTDSANALKGTRLAYLKALVIVKMLIKEISYLTAIKLDAESGAVDVTALMLSRDTYQGIVDSLKEDLDVYSNG